MERIQLPAALSTSKSVSMAHFFPGPGAYFSTADNIPEEHEDLNSASEIVRSRLYFRAVINTAGFLLVI